MSGNAGFQQRPQICPNTPYVQELNNSKKYIF